LLFSLAWLHQYGRSADVRDNKDVALAIEESLQYLKMRTKEEHLTSLLGVVNLLEAQQLLRNVRLLIVYG
jgi:hypothetical protein